MVAADVRRLCLLRRRCESLLTSAATRAGSVDHHETSIREGGRGDVAVAGEAGRAAGFADRGRAAGMVHRAVAVEAVLLVSLLGVTGVLVDQSPRPAPVEVPAGTQPGETILLRGRGMPPLGRGRTGDLRVVVNVAIPRRLTSEQRDLLERLSGTLTEDNLRSDEGMFAKIKRALAG